MCIDEIRGPQGCWLILTEFSIITGVKSHHFSGGAISFDFRSSNRAICVLQPPQFAVDVRQLSLALPVLKVILTVFLPDQCLNLSPEKCHPRVTVYGAFPVLELASPYRPDDLVFRQHSSRAVLSLRVAPLRCHSESRLSIGPLSLWLLQGL